jgi:hypothetical protein
MKLQGLQLTIFAPATKTQTLNGRLMCPLTMLIVSPVYTVNPTVTLVVGIGRASLGFHVPRVKPPFARSGMKAHVPAFIVVSQLQGHNGQWTEICNKQEDVKRCWDASGATEH